MGNGEIAFRAASGCAAWNPCRTTLLRQFCAAFRGEMPAALAEPAGFVLTALVGGHAQKGSSEATPAMTTVEKYYVGLSHTYSQVLDDTLVRAFAEVSGDRNPIHLDDETASKSRFGRRVAHGAILFSMISKVLGIDMPGAGTVYLSQVCNFKLPVFIGETVTLEAKIVEILPKSIARISTVITKQTGELVMDGEARVKLPGWLFTQQPDSHHKSPAT